MRLYAFLVAIAAVSAVRIQGTSSNELLHESEFVRNTLAFIGEGEGKWLMAES